MVAHIYLPPGYRSALLTDPPVKRLVLLPDGRVRLLSADLEAAEALRQLAEQQPPAPIRRHAASGWRGR